MKNRKILFIVEGKDSEPEIINHIYRTCFANENYKIYPYETDIHELTDKIFIGGEIDDAFDVQSYLRINCKSESDRNILSYEFSDIFLVFDLDAQDNRLNPERLLKLQEYFSESTENGKLYINYPSLEAYKNVNKMPDVNFKSSVVHKKDFTSYKHIVDGDTPYYTKVAGLDKKTLFGLALHHLKKLNYILANKYEPVLDDGISGELLNNILTVQLNKLQTEDCVFVISIMILHLFEYRPKKMLEVARDIASDLI